MPISQELYDAVLYGSGILLFFCFVGMFFMPETKETYEDLRRIYNEIKAAKAEKERKW